MASTGDDRHGNELTATTGCRSHKIGPQLKLILIPPRPQPYPHSGVPMLHVWLWRHQVAVAAAPPSAVALPSRVAGFRPFIHAPRVTGGVILGVAGEEGLGARWPVFRAALAMEAPGRVDGNGRTPLFFTFSPGMVVVYG
uniref:Uncharacterized protein n=1 Tax=Oryza glumipatula TaxID=40148 RepID=A0A0E0BKI9_9ORYZ